MLKLLWRFFLLVLLAIAFAWLADRPGSVAIQWLGRDIHMSVVVAVVLAIGGLIALSFMWSLLRRLWHSPAAAKEYLRFRKHRKGYEALSSGIIAAGAGDAQSAAKSASTARKALADEPLVNVLAAQAAQLRGDKAEVKRIFEEMAQNKDTSIFGLRGLFAEARNNGDLTAALQHAEKALALNSRLPWASTAMLQVQTARKSWDGAALTLEQQGRNGLLPKDEANRRRAVMLTAQALKLEQSNADAALDMASKAIDLNPGLVPAACVVARSQIAAGQIRRAAKTLKAAWAVHPHPELAGLMLHLDPNANAEAAFEKLRDMIGSPDASVEHGVALAGAALKAQRFDVARQALSQHVEGRPQARVCALMAQIEEAANDNGRVREWLARAVHAPRDPMWLADGVANLRWVPVSPVTGEIVFCEWKEPFDTQPLPPLFATTLTPPENTLLPTVEKAQPQTVPTTRNAPLPDDPGVAPEEENDADIKMG